MLRRLGVFIDALLELAERHRLDGELIVVEWNPPDGPRLHEVLKLRNSSDHLSIRFIEVPHALHARIPHSGTIPLFQMIAKNVGIRRARGHYIIATNQDILFSDGLIGLLANGPLDDHSLYRIDRYDVPAEVPVGVPIDDQIAWCNKNAIRVHRRYGSFDFRRRFLPTWSLLGWKSPSDLVRMGRHAIGGMARSLGAGISYTGELMSHGRVHTNACGDFTLLARERWQSLRGYAEFPLFSMHLDSLFCWQAVAAGAKQRILRWPCRIYHMEHRHSWVTMDWVEKLNTFVEKPWLDIGMLSEVQEEMRHEKNIAPINGPNWGLADLTLPQLEIRGGEKRTLASELPHRREQSIASLGG